MGERAREQALESSACLARIIKGSFERIGISCGLQRNHGIERIERMRRHAVSIGPVRFVHAFQRDGIVCFSGSHGDSIGHGAVQRADGRTKLFRWGRCELYRGLVRTW